MAWFHRFGSRAALVVSLFVLLVILVVLRPIPLGVPGQWVWLFLQGFEVAWGYLAVTTLAFGALFLIVVVGGRTFAVSSRLERAAAVVFLLLAAWCLQMSVGALPAGLDEAYWAVTSGRTNEYFPFSAEIDDIPDYLRHFRERSERSGRLDIGVHPPGPVMVFVALRRLYSAFPELADAVANFFERGIDPYTRILQAGLAIPPEKALPIRSRAVAWTAVLLFRLLAALVVIPAYLWGQRAHSPPIGLAAAGLCAVIPSLLLFSPHADQIYPVIALALVYAGWRAVNEGGAGAAFAAGLLFSLGMFFTIAFLLPAAVVGVIWLIHSVQAPASSTGPLSPALRWRKLFLGGLLGFFLPVLLLFLAGYNSFSGWAMCLAGNARFNALTQRGYWAWLAANPLCFLIFLGVPVAVLWVGSSLREFGHLIRRRWEEIDSLAFALPTALLLIWLVGVNRGEVERLWMMVMPLCVIGSVGRLDRRFLALALVVQMAQIALFKLQLNMLSLYQT